MTPTPSPSARNRASRKREERKKERISRTSILEERQGKRERGSKREKERGNGEQVENEIRRTREEAEKGGGGPERRESPDKKIQSSTSL